MQVGIATMWLCMFVLCGIPFFWNNWDDWHNQRLYRCTLFEILPVDYMRINAYILALPIVVSVYMNIHIVYTVKKAATVQQQHKQNQNLKWYVSVVIYVFNFALWLPLLVSLSVANQRNSSAALLSFVVCLSVSLSSSTMNPLLYAALKDSYRYTFKLVLKTPPWKWRSIRHRSILQDSISRVSSPDTLYRSSTVLSPSGTSRTSTLNSAVATPGSTLEESVFEVKGSKVRFMTPESSPASSMYSANTSASGATGVSSSPSPSCLRPSSPSPESLRSSSIGRELLTSLIGVLHIEDDDVSVYQPDALDQAGSAFDD